jgi:hypothetical protein
MVVTRKDCRWTPQKKNSIIIRRSYSGTVEHPLKLDCLETVKDIHDPANPWVRLGNSGSLKTGGAESCA